MNELTIQPLLEEHFFWLHKHPEQSYFEHETTAYIKHALGKANIEILNTGLKTGLVALISAARKNGALVALRADIDALPVTEESGCDYASQNNGFMHACGHDFHTAALLGAALLLKQKQAELVNDVLLVFQPAEEISGGAESVLATGALDKANVIFGLHVAPDYPCGTVALKSGGTFAAVSAFKITIKGKGGHAAMPQLCRDPVVAAAALIMAAQTIISRTSDPLDSVVLSFTHIEAGKTWNVIPETAFVEGTIRALGTKEAQSATKKLGAFCKAIELSHEVECNFDSWLDAPATNNDVELTRYAELTAGKLGLNVTAYKPTMAGEDFALYQEKIRGLFINFGVESASALHHPAFRANYKGLSDAARLLAELAFNFKEDKNARAA
ncbi:MAG: M20 peptidase aminoacylase family protein [Termitinemataceae bacterium]|nr:MAG: M20 peptidase aminoacylase family protein [Termitinemataceae bacterium]